MKIDLSVFASNYADAREGFIDQADKVANEMLALKHPDCLAANGQDLVTDVALIGNPRPIKYWWYCRAPTG